MTTSSRPPLDERLDGAQLRRWYWLHSELVALARRLGVPAGGGKQELSERLATVLDGGPVPAPGRPSTARPPALPEPMTSDTVLPPGQRCTQQLRRWFQVEAGPGFRFDAAMREHLYSCDGTTTLGDALAHWHTTRSTLPRPIGAQFELNRFARAWRDAHPDSTRPELLRAWRAHRALPVEARLPT